MIDWRTAFRRGVGEKSDAHRANTGLNTLSEEGRGPEGRRFALMSSRRSFRDQELLLQLTGYCRLVAAESRSEPEKGRVRALAGVSGPSRHAAGRRVERQADARTHRNARFKLLETTLADMVLAEHTPLGVTVAPAGTSEGRSAPLPLAALDA